MRRVARSEAPAVLADPNRRGPRELERVRAHMADPDTREESFKFQAYSDDGVKLALMELFQGKCAYCENNYASTAPVDVEHFRPKGAVAEDDTHPGYWWLAMQWENLLPSCIDCNRRRWQRLPDLPQSMLEAIGITELDDGRFRLGKASSFPIQGTRAAAEGDDVVNEQALLLDPTIDMPDDHLDYHFDFEQPLGLILPKVINGQRSPRGVASILAYGLNRLGLVQERTRVQRRLLFLAHLMADLESFIEDLDTQVDRERIIGQRLAGLVSRIGDEMAEMAEDDQPFSHMVDAWIRALQARQGQPG